MMIARLFLSFVLVFAPAGVAPVFSDENPAAVEAPVTPAGKLDALFAELKAAETAEAAKQIEQRIWSAWLESGSATVDLLLSRATTAMQSGNHILAMQILDTAIELKPDYAEGWNKRATLHYMMKNYGELIGDIQRTLALEPRHFGAMAGLGSIFKIIGDEESALEIYRRALEVHPLLEGAGKEVEKLAEEVEGRGI